MTDSCHIHAASPHPRHARGCLPACVHRRRVAAAWLPSFSHRCRRRRLLPPLLRRRMGVPEGGGKPQFPILALGIRNWGLPPATVTSILPLPPVLACMRAPHNAHHPQARPHPCSPHPPNHHNFASSTSPIPFGPMPQDFGGQATCLKTL